MLPLANRLKNRSDFAAVYAQGSYCSKGAISIKFLKTDLDITRIGFPVGKGFSKKAVQRNRIRRILREVARQQLPTLKPGFDIVVMPRPETRDMEFTQVAEILGQLLRKANLFS
ncbi:MAG TPA: ribonuclease P protein component [Patescibacteria group bacterium]